MQIPHPSIAEIMGQSNYDWVAVDMEHGAISVHHLCPSLSDHYSIDMGV
jgi:2-dehydro-3-deoxyglucarate aldolase